MTIVIVGAGIGGLAAALSLHEAGFRDVRIFERVAQLRPLGVGINLLPHAVRELTELRLGDRMAGAGVAPGTLSYFNRFGQQIWSEPRGLAAGYRWPQLSMYRGRLQAELLQAVQERLGEQAVQTGHRLIAVEQRGATGKSPAGTAVAPGPDTAQSDSSANHSGAAEGAVARFATAEGEVGVEAELVVGADGIHSALRRQHYPDEGQPIWNGLTLWRGTATVPAYLDGKTMIMAGDGWQKFVAYPVGPPGRDGRALINFIAERRQADADGDTVDWNRSVDPAPIVDLFADWRFDWLDVPALIAAAPEILEYPMVDRDPLPQWTFGRCTLLGDAAHPMYPNGSNGASQAILDARTLAYHLATAPTIDAGLQAYEADRRPATTALVLSNRRQGPEQVMVLAHERAPRGFRDIDEVFAPGELAEIAAGYKRAAGFHPDALNTRASLTP
ncbi:flavin-dependent oxidoreductase [Rhizocola hellebori]|uniref:Flavin-dependent oxidoreductase n=1 Tax=Rhizocola hellebori TaxID=1392758 RepID=A0A8J3VGY6_9ACTN|nr:flavin-dependent oxidoreductase [Rhizocola hellebori]GIH05471.1 flavin-dependent oxidoreductase [Rhizocola hellebori]